MFTLRLLALLFKVIEYNKFVKKYAPLKKEMEKIWEEMEQLRVQYRKAETIPEKKELDEAHESLRTEYWSIREKIDADMPRIDDEDGPLTRLESKLPEEFKAGVLKVNPIIEEFDKLADDVAEQTLQFIKIVTEGGYFERKLFTLNKKNNGKVSYLKVYKWITGYLFPFLEECDETVEDFLKAKAKGIESYGGRIHMFEYYRPDAEVPVFMPTDLFDYSCVLSFRAYINRNDPKKGIRAVGDRLLDKLAKYFRCLASLGKEKANLDKYIKESFFADKDFSRIIADKANPRKMYLTLGESYTNKELCSGPVEMLMLAVLLDPNASEICILKEAIKATEPPEPRRYGYYGH